MSSWDWQEWSMPNILDVARWLAISSSKRSMPPRNFATSSMPACMMNMMMSAMAT